jgi:hypothetical protein
VNHWFNLRRLHGEITDDATYTTPAEHEAACYRHTTPATEPVTQQPEQSRDPGRFMVTFEGHRVAKVGSSWCAPRDSNPEPMD